MPIHVPIKDESSRATPITVRGGYWDEDIFDQDWCNHDGAEMEDLTSNPGLDNEYTEKILVCDKCEAQYIGEEWVTV